MVKYWGIFIVILLFVLSITASAKVIVIKAGYLIDPDVGEIAENQIILIEDGKIMEIGSSVSIPADAEVIDLAGKYVLPGLVDAYENGVKMAFSTADRNMAGAKDNENKSLPSPKQVTITTGLYYETYDYRFNQPS